MIIFIRKIPEDTTISELMQFVEPSLKSWFARRGTVIDVQILVLRNRQSGAIEYHGLVNVVPDKAAERAVKRLKRQIFRGMKRMVRPYVTRSWHNDPRQYYPQHVDAKVIEKRIADRRRTRNLEVLGHSAPQFGNSGDFFRKLL